MTQKVDFFSLLWIFFPKEKKTLNGTLSLIRVLDYYFTINYTLRMLSKCEIVIEIDMLVVG